MPATCRYPEPARSSPRPRPISWRSILILSPIYAWVFQVFSLSLRFSHQIPVWASPLTHMRYMPSQSHSTRFYCPHNIWWGIRPLSSSLCSFLQSCITSSLLGPNIFLSILFSNTLSLRSSLLAFKSPQMQISCSIPRQRHCKWCIPRRSCTQTLRGRYLLCKYLAVSRYMGKH